VFFVLSPPPFSGGRCRNMTVVETNAVRNLYTIIHRLCTESMANESFRQRYGTMFSQLLTVLRRDLMDCAFASGDDWKELERDVNNFLDTWLDHSKPLLPNADSLHLDSAEGSIIRENVARLRAARRAFDSKMGAQKDTELKGVSVLQEVIDRLDSAYKEDAFGHLTRAAVGGESAQARRMLMSSTGTDSDDDDALRGTMTNRDLRPLARSALTPANDPQEDLGGDWHVVT
jgi:hypothetical protein